MPEKLGVIPVKDQVAKAVKIYAYYQDKILKELLKIDIGNYSEIKAIQAGNRIQNMIDRLNRETYKWARPAMDSAYNVAKRKTLVSLEILGSKKDPTFDNRLHKYTISEYEKAVMDDFLRANSSITNTVNSYIYLARRSGSALAQLQEFETYGIPAATEEEIELILEETILQELSWQSAQRRIQAVLAAQVIDGHLIKVGSKTYTLKYYANLVARTRLREIQTQAVKNYCEQYQNDLVEFSQHANACPICIPLEGQTYSISGTHPDYPMLTGDVEPPVHPACQHNINPTSERALRFREIYG
jgi:hypothetical protein